MEGLKSNSLSITSGNIWEPNYAIVTSYFILEIFNLLKIAASNVILECLGGTSNPKVKIFNCSRHN